MLRSDGLSMPQPTDSMRHPTDSMPSSDGLDAPLGRLNGAFSRLDAPSDGLDASIDRRTPGDARVARRGLGAHDPNVKPFLAAGRICRRRRTPRYKLECNGISIGLGFNATRTQLGMEDPPITYPDACASAPGG